MPRRSLSAVSLLFALLLLLASCGRETSGQAEPPGGDDYLDGELRSRVDQLVAEAESRPTTAETAYERADVLWAWANAVALDGRHLPAMLPGTVASLRTQEALGEAPSPSQIERLDGFIAELALRDEDPAALGTMIFTSTEPLVAGSRATVEQVWTVGTVPMQPGGKIALGMQLITAFLGRLQIDDPAAANYVTIRSSDPEARFEKTEVLIPGIHGAWRSDTPNPAFELRGTTLEPGASVTVTYGDTSRGGPGLEVQEFATTELLLPLYVDLDGSGLNLSPRWPALEVVGTVIAGVKAFAPSIVRPGEAFEISVRAEDRWANRATGSLPGWEVRLGSDTLHRIPPDAGPLNVVSDLRLDEPGTYRFDVRSEDRRWRTRTNPVWVREGGERLAWGETHVHSGHAEGQGTAEEVYRYALEDSRLDFLGYSEHDTAMDDGEWALLQRLARETTRPGRFAAFVGYEWTVRRDLGGHHNVFFRTPDHRRVSAHEAPLLPDLYRGLRREAEPEDVLVIPHAHQAADWTRSDAELERLVEIYSMHGTFQWFGDRYLRNGWEVGFIGASDDHRAKPGYSAGYPSPAPLKQDSGLAAVWVGERSPDAIFDALRSLQTYATSGERMVLQATLNGAAMGTRQEATAERRLAVTALGTAPIERIDVIRNGEVAFSKDYLTAPLEPECWLQVGFESSTVVYNPERDNPRPYRVWKGRLEVQGARIEELRSTAVDNIHEDRVWTDEDGRVHFSMDTRGRRDSFLLRLAGASPSTRLLFELEEATERGFAPVLKRPPATIPASEVELALSHLEDGRLEHPMTVDVHTDLITLQTLDPEGAFDRRFEWTDLAEPDRHDYYYVRVTQLDGERAWSSPFWVGERQKD